MTSTASKHSNLSNAFKRVSQARLVNSLLIFIASVAIAVLGVSIEFQNSDKQADLSESVLTLFGVLTIVLGFYSLSNATRMFKEIYKKQSCDFYFSTPIKREEYYVANFLYGALVDVLCFAVSGVIFVGGIKLLGFSLDNSYIPKSAGMVLAVLAIYSMFINCAVIAGKRLHYIFLSLICLFVTTTFLAGIIVQINSIWGLSVTSSLFSSISPVENAISCLAQEKVYGFIAISVVEIIVFFITGLISFKSRKVEVAEVEVSGKIMPCFFQAILVGAAFFEFGVGNTFFEVALGIVAGVVATIVFCKIFYKKTFVKPAVITLAAVCAFCTFTCVLVSTPVFNAYVKYIPKVDEVEYVECSEIDEDDFSSIANIFVSDMEGFDEYGKFELKEPENIKKAIKLHEYAVSDDVIKASKHKNNISVIKELFFSDYDNYVAPTSFHLTYHLKNGSVVKRSYVVYTKDVNKALLPVYRNSEAVKQLAKDRFSGELLCASYEFYDEKTEYYSTKLLDGFDAQKFLEAYEKDMLEMSDVAFSYRYLPSGYAIDGYYDDSTYSVSLTLYSLDPDGYGTRWSDETIEKVKNMTPEDIMYQSNANYPISQDYIHIDSCQKHTIEYLDSIGMTNYSDEEITLT